MQYTAATLPRLGYTQIVSRGVVLKKWGTPETRLRQRFTVTQNINSSALKLSYTAFQCVTSCNSGLTFARISVQKVGGVADASPLSKKVGVGRRPHASSPHYTPDRLVDGGVRTVTQSASRCVRVVPAGRRSDTTRVPSANWRTLCRRRRFTPATIPF